MTAMRRAIDTLRYINDLLVRASEATRTGRVPQQHPQASAPVTGASAPAERADAPAGSPSTGPAVTERVGRTS